MTQPDEELVLGDDLDPDQLDPDERDLEAPAADAFEQVLPANPAQLRVRPHVPFEADEYDAIEQTKVVDLEDEY
jgi:hypothetical protein